MNEEKKSVEISLVIPCYNEEESIPQFYREACKILVQMNLNADEKSEFIFVDDGSHDKTLQILKEISQNDRRVHFISFSRNFGKESALYAGLKKSKGNFIAVMDADLQDPPSLLPQMMNALKNEGYDCTATFRSTRKNEPVIRSFFARRFYRLMENFSDVPIKDGARDFRLMTKKYKDAVLSLSEKNRFTKGIFSWVGFSTKYFAYENVERVAGKTKWSFWKLFLYSIDGITGFSTKPLSFAVFGGIFTTLIAFAMIAFIVARKIIYGDSVRGWASTICIMLFLSGIQFFTIGILGIYVSKIYTEVKDRPIFIVREEN
jgi:glycosyltransferase involved in cell wall biosynthesis